MWHVACGARGPRFPGDACCPGSGPGACGAECVWHTVPGGCTTVFAARGIRCERRGVRRHSMPGRHTLSGQHALSERHAPSGRRTLPRGTRGRGAPAHALRAANAVESARAAHGPRGTNPPSGTRRSRTHPRPGHRLPPLSPRPPQPPRTPARQAPVRHQETRPVSIRTRRVASLRPLRHAGFTSLWVYRRQRCEPARRPPTAGGRFPRGPAGSVVLRVFRFRSGPHTGESQP